MAQATEYEPEEPAREAIDALPGAVLLEFGTPWCGHCRMTQPFVARDTSESFERGLALLIRGIAA